MNGKSCREKIIKFMLNYRNGNDHGVIGYHIAQGVEEKYATVIFNLKRLIEDGIVLEIPFDCPTDKKVKCKYELQPFYYDERLYLEMYNFLVPYLEAIHDSSSGPFDAKVVLKTIFNEVLDNHD